MKRTDITEVFPDATKEQIDKLLGINGADIETAKAGMVDLKGQLATANDRIAELEQRPTDDALLAAQNEAAALRATIAIRDMRSKVSKETGVPVELLTADDEESCTEQANGIIRFKFVNQYPNVRDGGEVTPPAQKPTTAQQFADWFNQNI